MTNNEEQTAVELLFSELTEDQKKALAKGVVRAILEVRAKEHREMMDYLFTPFYIRWYRKFKLWIQRKKS
jgi:hypothetical protein